MSPVDTTKKKSRNGCIFVALRFVFLLLLVLVLLMRQDAIKVFMMFELDGGLQGKLFISHASEGDREVVWFLHCTALFLSVKIDWLWS